MSVSVCGRMYDLILSCFKVVFECDSVFIFAGVVPELIFGVKVASCDVRGVFILVILYLGGTYAAAIIRRGLF